MLQGKSHGRLIIPYFVISQFIKLFPSGMYLTEGGTLYFSVFALGVKCFFKKCIFNVLEYFYQSS